MCHDLDHRGTNNSFQVKADSNIAQLYSTSTMEHHHFDQCVMIMNSKGNRILDNMSQVRSFKWHLNKHSDLFGRKSSNKYFFVWKYIAGFHLSIRGHWIPLLCEKLLFFHFHQISPFFGHFTLWITRKSYILWPILPVLADSAQIHGCAYQEDPS